MQRDPMSFRALAIIISALLGALFWDLGSIFHLVFIHLVLPILWGTAIALWWPMSWWWLRVSSLVVVVVVCEALRVTVYGLAAGWEYVMSDIVAQYLTLYSLAAQFIVAFVALVVAGAVSTRRRKYDAA